jgi:hypothetical protein
VYWYLRWLRVGCTETLRQHPLQRWLDIVLSACGSSLLTAPYPYHRCAGDVHSVGFGVGGLPLLALRCTAGELRPPAVSRGPARLARHVWCRCVGSRGPREGKARTIELSSRKSSAGEHTSSVRRFGSAAREPSHVGCAQVYRSASLCRALWRSRKMCIIKRLHEELCGREIPGCRPSTTI